ncbi:hypothetical protein CPT_Metamorpho_091 [Klebsiella phage Metamorpho]|nr:hypothetical protein CPT_Metamorpho_091 [Klebsiella phage Metamorpho]
MTPIEIHFKHESGLSFQDIAKQAGISPKEAAYYYVKVEVAKEKFKQKEKVVYRKRLTNVGIKSRHKKLVKHMRTL